MRRRGFTIIELLVTIFIIGLLLTAAAAGVVRARKAGRDSQRARDIFTIGIAVDQSATGARGLYPYMPNNKTTDVMCANVLGNTAENTTNAINLGLFIGRAIPTDPLPEVEASSCANYRNGYTYSNRYGGNNLAKPSAAGAQHYEYVLEIGLETDVPADAQTLVRGTDATSTQRRQYLLLGKPCSAGTGGTCSVP